MATDNERREVARKLRGLTCCPLVAKELGLEYNDSMPNSWLWFTGKSVDRLADLIEPEPERTCRDTSPMSYKFTCSECHSSYRFGSEHKVWYCPYCGAKVVDNGA